MFECKQKSCVACKLFVLYRFGLNVCPLWVLVSSLRIASVACFKTGRENLNKIEAGTGQSFINRRTSQLSRALWIFRAVRIALRVWGLPRVWRSYKGCKRLVLGIV